MNNQRNAILEMEATLRAEAELLRNGALDKIGIVSQRKQDAWVALQKPSLGILDLDLDRIRKLAAQNAQMLIAARQGVDAVRRLREALKAGPAPLKTYAADGRKTSFSLSASASVRKRSV